TKGHGHIESSAGPRSGVNDQLPANRLQPFPHADQSQPLGPRGTDIEPDSVVTDCHCEALVPLHQLNGNLSGGAVLDGVLKRLLDNTVHAERQLLRQGDRHVVEANCHLDVWMRNLSQKTVEPSDEADEPELGRMQTMRQVVHALGNSVRALEGYAGEFARVPA